MPKATTPSSITEISLKTSSWEEAILGKRFWTAKQQYNTFDFRMSELGCSF